MYTRSGSRIAGLDVSDCVHAHIHRRLLDDKVMLNELMGGSNPTHEHVVPRGFRLPQQYSQLREAAAAAPTVRWMLKKGVAHGGNGNRLLAADLDDEDELEGCSDHVVQRYIHNPLLIDKLKFHLRLYVVVLATAPALSAFICRDGTCACWAEVEDTRA